MQQRITWKDLPAGTRAAVERRTGPVLDTVLVSQGMNSALACVLDTAGGEVFVKGIRTGHPGVVTQRREAGVNRYVRHLSPALLWSIDDADGWNVLGFENVRGRTADYRPGSLDLPAVLDVLTAAGRTACPQVAEAKTAVARWASYIDDPDDLAWLDGQTLLHTDYKPDNLIITPDGAARLVDWAWPTRGAAWIDPCCLLVCLVAAGHTVRQAEELLACCPAWQAAPRRGLGVFARAASRMWDEIARHDPQPWKQRMAQAAHDWLEERSDGRGA